MSVAQGKRDRCPVGGRQLDGWDVAVDQEAWMAFGVRYTRGWSEHRKDRGE